MSTLSHSQPHMWAREAPLCTVSDLLWLLYLYPVRLLSAVAPAWLLYACGRLAEPVVQWITRRQRESAVRWIVSSGCRAEREAAQISRQAVSNNMFRILDDLLLLRPGAPRKLRCESLQGIEHLESAQAAGAGVLLLSGHFCANRIAERYLPAIGLPVLSVHNQKPRNSLEGRLGRETLQPRYLEMQRRATPDVIYIQDPDCTLKIMRRLRSGGLVNIQLDGIPSTRFLEHSLLGRSRRFPAGIVDIVRLSGCAVVPMLCLGGATRFSIQFGPRLEITAARGRAEFAAANLPVLVRALEIRIQAHPEEWRLWSNR